MRIYLNLDDELLEQAKWLTGISDNVSLVQKGLQALIERESARQLSRLGGSEPQ
ncbi:type II toxin-antitoxin system VapB family antitoxin [Thiohalobacter thiocyanaticus]|uniref:type II toxin-antitoxin system VapB family antitoxin n=1 Tax=Thiohalobacter thiocyanaticus TaxID=585455 RepID=UPI000BBA64F3|nr:type II toxin-antitoxin system VapB family antitoxin [Thiohalobacter thiocyanaticus]